jgi:uncharacterized protein YcbX
MTNLPPITVTGLNVYPVKACGGIALQQAAAGRMGFSHDRQWMFVDERGMFVAQRDSRGLGVGIRTTCLITTSIADHQLTLTAPGMPPLRLPVEGRPGREVQVRIWDSVVAAADQGDEASQWATGFLSHERPGRYQLVRMPDEYRRAAPMGDGELAFGDAYPFLIISEESLADLNSRLEDPLPMNRFRPNIVLRGAMPYAEDLLDRFRIGTSSSSGRHCVCAAQRRPPTRRRLSVERNRCGPWPPIESSRTASCSAGTSVTPVAERSASATESWLAISDRWSVIGGQ